MGVTEAANFQRPYLTTKATERLVLIGGLVLYIYSSNNTVNSDFTDWSPTPIQTVGFLRQVELSPKTHSEYDDVERTSTPCMQGKEQ